MKSGDPYLEKLFYHLRSIEHDFRNHNLNQLIVHFLQGKTLLDVGCGAAHLLVQAQLQGFKVFGIEPNKKLIYRSKKIYPFPINIDCLSAEQLSLIKQKYDSITMIDVLEHIKDDASVLKKIKNNLVNNGRLILVVPSYPGLYGIRDKNLGHCRRYSKKNFIKKLSSAGFSIEKIRHWNFCGVLPYFIFVKLFRKNLLTIFIRTRKKQAIWIYLAINSFLNFWFKHVENNLDFKVGLNLIVVAKPL